MYVQEPRQFADDLFPVSVICVSSQSLYVKQQMHVQYVFIIVKCSHENINNIKIILAEIVCELLQANHYLLAC